MQTRYFVKSALIAPNPPMMKGSPKAMYAEFAKGADSIPTCVSGLFTKDDIEEAAKYYEFKPKFIDVLDAPALDTLRHKTKRHKTVTQEWQFDWDDKVWRKRAYFHKRGYTMFVADGSRAVSGTWSITALRDKTKREEVWFTKHAVEPGVRYFPENIFANAPSLTTPDAATCTEHNARVKAFDIGFVDGAGSALVPTVTLEYDNYVQNFGGFIIGGDPGSRAAGTTNSAGAFIVGVLSACGVDAMSECKGSIVRIRTKEQDGNDVIVAIGHAIDKDKWFNPSEVFEQCRKHLKQTT